MSHPKISINLDDDQQNTQASGSVSGSGSGNEADSTTSPPPTTPADEQQTNSQSTQAVSSEIELLQTEIAQLKDSLARSQAEFANYRRRQTQELESMIKFASGQTINTILPVIDNLQRAFTHIPEDIKDNTWVNGVIAIEKQFIQTLEKLGLKKIVTVGEKADPNFHEVISTADQPGTEKDTIINELEAGYTLNDKVLRVAKVIVQK